jgi:hypothetical protein
MNTVRLVGKREGRPSKRLSLQLPQIKVASAKIIQQQKGKLIEFEIVRINHLPKLQEIRLHTAQLLYPGEYSIELSYTLADASRIDDLKIPQFTSMKFST